MPYKVSYQNCFERDLKKITKKNKPLKDIIKVQVLQVIENPNIGELYSGNLYPFRKIGFGESPQYRLIYVLYDCCPIQDKQEEIVCRFDDVEELEDETICQGMVEFIFIKTREDCNNLYRKSKKYFEKYLRED